MTVSINIYIHLIIANVQDICNLIGREEYNIDRIIFSISNIQTTTFKFHGRKKQKSINFKFKEMNDIKY